MLFPIIQEIISLLLFNDIESATFPDNLCYFVVFVISTLPTQEAYQFLSETISNIFTRVISVDSVPSKKRLVNLEALRSVILEVLNRRDSSVSQLHELIQHQLTTSPSSALSEITTSISNQLPQPQQRMRTLTYPDGPRPTQESSEMDDLKSDQDMNEVGKDGHRRRFQSVYLSFPQDRINDSMTLEPQHTTSEPIVQSENTFQAIREELLLSDGIEYFDVVGELVPLVESLVKHSIQSDTSLLELLSALLYRQVYRECCDVKKDLETRIHHLLSLQRSISLILKACKEDEKRYQLLVCSYLIVLRDCFTVIDNTTDDGDVLLNLIQSECLQLSDTLLANPSFSTLMSLPRVANLSHSYI